MQVSPCVYSICDLATFVNTFWQISDNFFLVLSKEFPVLLNQISIGGDRVFNQLVHQLRLRQFFCRRERDKIVPKIVRDLKRPLCRQSGFRLTGGIRRALRAEVRSLLVLRFWRSRLSIAACRSAAAANETEVDYPFCFDRRAFLAAVTLSRLRKFV